MSEIILPTSSENTQADKPTMLAHEPFFKKWGGLFVLTLGLAIVIIDTTLLNVSLGTIIKDLHTNLQNIQWVITVYALVLTAFTITGGRLGDLFGRRKMFMLGAIIFAVGSFLASVSHAIPVLLLGESIIEGFGAALMMPATASLVVANFQGADRSKAFGIWGAVAGASSAIGPLLGGYLTTHYSWRWGFRINVFIAVLVIIGSLLLIKESRDERKPKLDFMGVFLSSFGLLSLVFGIIESSSYGWWKAKEAFLIKSYSLDLWGYSIVPFALAIGIIFLIVFLLWENYRENQGKSVLVTGHLFQNRQFTVGTSVTAMLTLAMTGQLFALPIFLQSVKNLDAFHTGLALLPLSATLLVVAPLVGMVSKYIQPRYLIWLGLTIDVIAPFVIAATLKPDMQISHLIPGLMLYGLGMGLLFPPLSDITLSAVPVEMAGEASGVNNTFRQLGTTLGAAIIGAAVLTSLGSALAKGVNASPVIPSTYKQQIATQLSSPSANVEFGGESNLASTLPPQVVGEIHGLTQNATTQANKDAYVYAALFAFIGLVVALFLPKTSTEHHVEGQSVAIDTKPVSGSLYAAALVLVVVGAFGAWAILHHSASKTVTTGALADTANSIRNAFAPDTNVAMNSGSSSATSTQSSSGSQAATSSSASDFQQSQPPKTGTGAAPTTTKVPVRSDTATVTKPAVVQPPVQTVFRSSVLGFELTLSSNWQAQQVKNNEVVLVSSSGNQDTIETYDGFSGSLDDVSQQLSGSLSVRGVHFTTFQEEQAVAFTTTFGQQGIAVIHNGRLYYILASSFATAPLHTFKFI